MKFPVMSPDAAPAGAPAPSAPAPSAPPTQAGAKPGAPQGGAEPADNTPNGVANPPAPEKPAKPQVKEYKINGKIVKLTEEERDQYVSLGFASDERFKTAAQLRKQAEAVISKLRNPDSVIDALMDPALGLSKDQIRAKFEEWYDREFIAPEKLSPEQKELLEAKEKVRKYEEAEKERNLEKDRAQQEAMTTEAREALQTQIIQALETGKLPKTNFTIRRLAYWMQRNQANGFNAPTEVLIGQVKNEINSNLRDLVEASDGDVLIGILGDSIIDKIRKHDLAQLKKRREGLGAVQPSDDVQPMNPTRQEGHISSSEATARLREMQRTGRY